MNRNRDRIVITGVGIVSSLGIGKEEFWDSLSKGRSGVSEVSSFDTSSFQTHLGGEVKRFDYRRWIDGELPNESARATQFLIAASSLAYADAGWALDGLRDVRTGVCVGTNMGEIQALERIDEALARNQETSISSELVRAYAEPCLSSRVMRKFGFSGPSIVIPTACSAGNFAIGYAYDLLRLGRADVMFAGGVDPFSRIAFTGFNRLFAVTKSRCSPFDKNRSGIVVGEGCGTLILERLNGALSRGAVPYAEVLGYGLSCDAFNMVAPTVGGIVSAMSAALRSCGKIPRDVDYICAHGTGTIANDKTESAAVNQLFRDQRPDRVPISSIKSMLGHTMGAASAIEAIACALSIRHSLIPPTINFETPDPECDVDCVPNESRHKELNIVLNNSFAFGGNNASLVLGKITK